MKHKNLIVDTNNVVYIIRHAKIKTPKNLAKKEKMVAEFIFKESLAYILSFAKLQKIDSIIIACESGDVWRKDIFPDYKGNRNHAEDPYYEDIKKAIGLLRDFFSNYTAGYVLEVQRCEADDIIAVIAQETTGNVENYILSSDKDFIQLSNNKTFIYSPHKKDWINSNDPHYDLFFKCIRGDSGDNIRPAFPRVRATVLEEAWGDKYKMMNLLESTTKEGKVVEEALEFNMKLIDLTRQPDDLRQKIKDTILNFEPSKYSQLAAMKVLRDHGVPEFTKVLEFNDKPLKTPPVFNFTK